MVAKIIERLKYSYELWKWERQKRKEGFPKEWFDEDVARVDEIQADLKDELYKNYRGNPNWSSDD